MLIGVRPQSGVLRGQVCGTGIGIAAHQHDDIFKEFHQLGNDECDRQKGLGLGSGLAIAKGLAVSMGARITLMSQPGRGSVFSLWLPKAEPARHLGTLTSPDAGKLVNVLSTKPMQAATSLGGLEGVQVLVVDDEASVRLSMTSLLQSWGCEVRIAEGPDDALLLAQQHSPQLLVTDYRLRNGRTGGDEIPLLREHCGQAQSAVIITGDTDPARLRETAGYRATLLHKPVSALTLRDALIALT